MTLQFDHALHKSCDTPRGSAAVRVLTPIAVGVAAFGALVPAGAALGHGSAVAYVHGLHHALVLGAAVAVSTRSARRRQGSQASFISQFASSHRLRPLAVQRHIPAFVQGLRQTQAAVAYAERMHAGQHRADGTPFILHPLEVASLLYYAGAADHLIAAGVMHDLVEKTDASASDLRERFGPRITRIVLAVSDDGQIAGYANRKAALRQQVAGAGDEALALFAADKLSKLRELRRETAVDSEAGATPGRVRELRARRLKHYRRSLALLEERLPESPLVRELRDELAALLRERAVLAVTS
jgi:HD domain